MKCTVRGTSNQISSALQYIAACLYDHSDEYFFESAVQSNDTLQYQVLLFYLDCSLDSFLGNESP